MSPETQDTCPRQLRVYLCFEISTETRDSFWLAVVIKVRLRDYHIIATVQIVVGLVTTYLLPHCQNTKCFNNGISHFGISKVHLSIST